MPPTLSRNMSTFRPLFEDFIRRSVAVKSGQMPATLRIAGRTSTVVHQPDSRCIQSAIGPIARLGRIMCGSACFLPAMLSRSNLSSETCPRMERDLPLRLSEILLEILDFPSPKVAKLIQVKTYC
ncbi:hypothetical protein Y032_0464g1922 [Ancylostoma ceylanicum]|uniref:Uncharacterized protein n=1 Tax=Ancylostoma ceylanicum TaxID=53326 RepID=A0A016WYH7_9BILA|nr:hypothetical protein Y032_0464g1922 [Ancylostoma ceylanicum]